MMFKQVFSRQLYRLTFFILLNLFLFISVSLYAQQSIQPLKPGEYRTIEEDISFSPKAQISGHYYIAGSMNRQGVFSGTVLKRTMVQDIELKIESKINTNLSLNVTIANASSDLTQQDSAYQTFTSGEMDKTSTSGGGWGLTFSEAYVEYNHNPNARLFVGLQPITVANTRGLIYRGTDIAVTQKCGIGTWCYEVGGARLGDNGSMGMFWTQLKYPFYESGVLMDDQWSDQSQRSDVALTFELLRVVLGGNAIPLGEYGGWTGKESQYHEQENSKYVYFNYDKMEYLGLVSQLYYHNWDIHFSWIGQGGTRSFYTESESLGSKGLVGYASLLDVGYKFSDVLKGVTQIFSASGNNSSGVDTDEWDANSNAFYEVKKGSYGDALIYFNSDNGLGLGHSISNLTYVRANLSYRPKSAVSMETDVYLFSHTKPIWVQYSGESAKAVSDIGIEVDYSITYQLERNLMFSAQFAYFSAGKAYRDNDNDNVINATVREDFTMIGLSCKYMF